MGGPTDVVPILVLSHHPLIPLVGVKESLHGLRRRSRHQLLEHSAGVAVERQLESVLEKGTHHRGTHIRLQQHLLNWEWGHNAQPGGGSISMGIPG